MIKRRAAQALVMVVMSAGAAWAQAPDENPAIEGQGFWQPGGWVLWAEPGMVLPLKSAVRLAWTSIEQDRVYAASVRLSLDRFHNDWLSTGLVAGAGIAHIDLPGLSSDTRMSAVVGPRLGVRLPIGKVSLFWPRVSALYDRGGGTNAVGFEVHAPAVRQIFPRFLLGFGPSYEDRIDLSDGSHQRAFTLKVSLGGTFPGARQAPLPPPVQRFGRNGQWVISAAQGLTFDTGNSAFLTHIRLPDRDMGELHLVGSADYFLIDHISFGFSGGLTAVDETRQGQALSGRMALLGVQGGAAIPLGNRLVMWPRIAALWGRGDVLTRSALQFFIPFAVELGQLLVGLGPSYEILDRKFNVGREDYTTTAVGVSMLIGGWWRNFPPETETYYP